MRRWQGVTWRAALCVVMTAISVSACRAERQPAAPPRDEDAELTRALQREKKKAPFPLLTVRPLPDGARFSGAGSGGTAAADGTHPNWEVHFTIEDPDVNGWVVSVTQGTGVKRGDGVAAPEAGPGWVRVNEGGRSALERIDDAGTRVRILNVGGASDAVLLQIASRLQPL